MMELEVGSKIGNFVLQKKIESVGELWEVLDTYPSVFCRHKMYPTSFIANWSIKNCNEWVERGYFWVATKPTE